MTLTFYFNQIFSSYQDFETFCSDYNVYTKPITSEDTAFMQWAWQELLAKYSLNNVQYSTPDAFKIAFAQVLRQQWDSYKRQLQLIKKVQQLTDDEYIQAMERIANTAENPNTSPVDPKKPLEFVSAQVWEMAHDNKMDAFLRAINNMPTTRAYEFVEKFRFLFKPYFYDTHIFYPEE